MGEHHSAAVTENGDLYCWGDNEYGQVGDGTMGCYPQTSPIKVLSNVSAVSLGWDYSAAVTENGDLYCWGHNEDGQVGNGATNYAQTSPVKVLSNVSTVSLGRSYSAAVTTDGDLYCWGYNGYGQVGNGTTWNHQTSPVKVLSNVSMVSLGDYLGKAYSAAVTTNGDLYCWGDNEYGEVGNGTTEKQRSPVKVLSNVSEVSLRGSHSAAVTTNGDLYCWGRNEHGEVGNGMTENQTSPVKVLSNVSEVSLGEYHSAAVTENGDLYCWGSGYETGTGTTETLLSTPVKVSINNTDDSTDSEDPAYYTSTSGVCSSSSIRSLLGNSDYSSYVASLRSIDMVIPGLKQTNMGNDTACYNMVPQGVCATNNYVLISAYCKDAEHNSAIYVMNKKTKKYVTTILLSVEDDAGLKDGNHVGGLAFGNNTVYIAGSGDKKVWELPYSVVSNAVSSGKDAYEATISKNNYISTINASFIYWDDSYEELFVGNFDDTNADKNFMYSYDVKTGKVTSSKIQLPKQTQGVSFGIGKDHKTYCICSKSYGRTNQSEIYVAELQKLTNSFHFGLTDWHKITTPNMSEDIQVLGGTLYNCFESASNTYNDGGEKEQPFDRIPYIDVRTLISSVMKNTLSINKQQKKAITNIENIMTVGEDEIVDRSGIVSEGSCGENVNYCLYDDGELLVSGQGSMEDYSEDTAPWNDYKDTITSVYIDRGVTGIGAYAFYNCSNLTQVTASEYMNTDASFTIGNNAFGNCSLLEAVTLPDISIAIQSNAFDESATIQFNSDSSDVREYTMDNDNMVLHQHDFEYVETVKATCMESGYDLYRCKCGSEEVANIVEATAEHSYKEVERSEATETEEGFVKYQCENCIDTYTENLEYGQSSNIPKVTETPSSTKTPTATETPLPTKTPTVAETPLPTKTPTVAETPLPTKTPTVTETPSPAKEPSSATKPSENKNRTIVKKPSKVSGLVVKNKKNRKIIVSWNRKTNVSGFQIQYAQNKKFTKKKKSELVGKRTSQKTITKLKKGKTYYVRVRAYKKSSGKKIYGKWSKIKKIKTRK